MFWSIDPWYQRSLARNQAWMYQWRLVGRRLKDAAKLTPQGSELFVLCDLSRTAMAMGGMAVRIVVHGRKVGLANYRIRSRSASLLWEIP